MIRMLRKISSTRMNDPMKHFTTLFIALFFTTSFLFLGSVNANSTAKQYGPVKAGQTLWGIAYKTRPKGITRLEMMDALHKLNPSSFDKGNINRLKKGAMLTLPTKEIISQLLTGGEVEIAAVEDDNNKDLKTLRTELKNVKAALAKSKQALQGLNDQSKQFKQAEQRVKSLIKDNESLRSNTNTVSKTAKVELATVAKKYATAQAQITQLEVEKKELQELAKQTPKAGKASANDSATNKEAVAKLTAISADLVESKKLIKELAQKNKALQENSLDPKLLKDTKQELASTAEELDALKIQNQLLREQAANADVTDQERKDNNRKFSETIAALNSDIGQLRTRIKELEELEKMKDNHITELQKSLDHATVVIKEQAEVNKKMYARLNDMEKADEAKQQEQDDKAAAAITNTNPSNPTPPAELSGESAAIVNFADKPGASSMAIADSMKHISPKFWLMITLAGLLFVLALLWRVVAGKDEPEEVAA